MGDEQQSQPKQRKQYGTLRLSEKVIGGLAFIILAGWVVKSTTGSEAAPVETGFPWFATASIASALIVITLLAFKINCLEFVPVKLQQRLLPIVCILPVIGFLIEEMSSVETAMTVGGAIALAYISATSYWRNIVPNFVKDPLATQTRERRDDESAAATAAPPAAGPAPTPAPASPAENAGDPRPTAGAAEATEAKAPDSTAPSSPDEPARASPADRTSASGES